MPLRDNTYSIHSRLTTILLLIPPGLLFLLSLITAGIYGHDLRSLTTLHIHAPAAWVFAVVVAGLTAVTQIVYFIPFTRKFVRPFTWPWDWVLFIFWTAVFGTFAKRWIGKGVKCGEVEQGWTSCKRMKSGVWVDLVAMLVALVAASSELFQFREEERGGCMC